jgi:hypothetical protein
MLADIAGWAGSLLYITAYLLLCMKKLNEDHSFYHLLNILGAFGLIVNANHWNDYPNIVVNVVWMAIGLAAIIAIMRKKYVH